MILLLIIIFLFCSQAYAGNAVEMVEVEAVDNKIEKNDKLSDILRHCRGDRFGTDHGRATQAHETVHAINSHTRNYLFLKGRKRVNTFYCGGGKAIVVENPSLRIRHVSKFVPRVLRGNRYELYFVEQLRYWDEVPTYLMDEWSAYIAGAEVGVEDLENGLAKENSDIVCGPLEFSIYCTALCMATKEHDPDYWARDERLKHSTKYFLIRAEKVYFKGCESFKFPKQQELLEDLRTHEDSREVRNFLLNEFDGIFIK